MDRAEGNSADRRQAKRARDRLLAALQLASRTDTTTENTPMLPPESKDPSFPKGTAPLGRGSVEAYVGFAITILLVVVPMTIAWRCFSSLYWLLLVSI